MNVLSRYREPRREQAEPRGLTSRPPTEFAIEVSHLRKSYGPTVAVEDVSFSVGSGEIFGVIGPNGAGKTTAVECVGGLRNPDSGSISVLGLDPGATPGALRQVVGTQLQEGSMPVRLRVRRAGGPVRLLLPAPGRHGNDLLDLLGLAPKRDAYYGRLSGGQKQRVAIALALVGKPKVAILDELTTGLDPQARRDTWELVASIRDQGRDRRAGHALHGRS